MAITLNISQEAEQVLRQAFGPDLDQAALEALVVEAYRSGRIGTAVVRQLLRLATRWDAERWLGERGVYLNYSLEDLQADREALDRLLGKTA